MALQLNRFDPYLREFDATVTRISAGAIELDRTAFFARSGGQIGDVGSIGSSQVIATEYAADGEVCHFVAEEPTNLQPGHAVFCRIDWERRFRLMRLHTAQHLVELGFRELHNSPPCVGGEVLESGAYVDLPCSVESFRSIDLPSVERWVQSVIDDNLRIEHNWSARPYWHLDGVGSIACTGTHVGMTAEVGAVELRAELVAKERVRVSLRLAGPAPDLR